MNSSRVNINEVKRRKSNMRNCEDKKTFGENVAEISRESLNKKLFWMEKIEIFY